MLGFALLRFPLSVRTDLSASQERLSLSSLAVAVYALSCSTSLLYTANYGIVFVLPGWLFLTAMAPENHHMTEQPLLLARCIAVAVHDATVVGNPLACHNSMLAHGVSLCLLFAMRF